jgi:hypothetical protein
MDCKENMSREKLHHGTHARLAATSSLSLAACHGVRWFIPETHFLMLHTCFQIVTNLYEFCCEITRHMLQGFLGVCQKLVYFLGFCNDVYMLIEMMQTYFFCCNSFLFLFE